MTDIGARSGGQDFLRHFKGKIITAQADDYNDARSIWNKDANRYPLAVVQPIDVNDVVAAVRFAREAALLTAVRCGGHSYQGHSTCDDGIVIDLSAKMANVQLDPASNVVHAKGGALLGMIDRAAVPSGRVVPAGIVSHTGLGGLALGGGIGYLSRSFGLTCDQFRRLRVVTAAGDVVHASPSENPDLFWALRGGGGNFGIVTDFELRTHELGRVQAGMLVYSMDAAVDVIGALAQLLEEAPRELSIWFALAVKPSMTPCAGARPEDQRLLAAIVVYRGDKDDEILRRVRSCRMPLADAIQEEDFLAVQSRLDEVAQHGVGWYMKSGHVKSLSTGLIERMVTSSLEYQKIASPFVSREVYAISALGGAASDIGEEETAYSGRGANWHCAVEVGFTNQEERDRVVTWTKADWVKTEKLLDMRTSYVNLNFEEGDGAMEKVYGAAKLRRLQDVKRTYDPDNFFRLNANIVPSAT